MHKFIATIVTLALLFIAAPAVAGLDDFVKGANGVATSPLDIAAGLVEPERLFDMADINEYLASVNVVTDRVGGFAVGLKNFGERLGLGLADCLTFMITEKVEGPFSPDPRFEVLSSVE